MPIIENVEQVKAVALCEFSRIDANTGEAWKIS
jgi:hypothetical protein